MDEIESVSPTGDVGDMLGIGEPSAEQVAAPEASATSDQPAEPVQAQEQVTDPAVAYEGQTPAPTAVPTPQSIRIGDRDYTAQEVEAWKTSAQQLGHLQKKRLEELEQLNQLRQAQTQPQPTQQQQFDPKGYMQTLREKYDPVVKKYAENGLISQDYATLFPGEAAQMVHYAQRHEYLEQVVRAMAGEFQQRTKAEQSNGLVNEVARSISNLAQSGEPFAPLKEPAKVQEFFNYLWEMNPQVSHLRNPDFLARQWVAFNKDQYLQTAQTRAAQATRTNAARYARADATGGTRAPGVNQEPMKTPLDEMFEDHLARSS